MHAGIDFRLYVITDRHQCPGENLQPVVAEACEAGVKAVQLREKDLSARALFELAHEMKNICHRYGTKLFINDRADIAAAAATDGVQLTAQSLPVAAARTLLKTKLVGVSTHSLAEAERAADSGCDFILFGPIFDTPSKVAYGPPQGLARLRDVAKRVNVPVFAVGGITPPRSRACLEHGAFGVAVISAIMGAPVSQTIDDFKNYMGEL
jgi:thiamine-phosphate pyrophosphorylase